VLKEAQFLPATTQNFGTQTKRDPLNA